MKIKNVNVWLRIRWSRKDIQRAMEGHLWCWCLYRDRTKPQWRRAPAGGAVTLPRRRRHPTTQAPCSPVASFACGEKEGKRCQQPQTITNLTLLTRGPNTIRLTWWWSMLFDHSIYLMCPMDECWRVTSSKRSGAGMSPKAWKWVSILEMTVPGIKVFWLGFRLDSRNKVQIRAYKICIIIGSMTNICQ